MAYFGAFFFWLYWMPYFGPYLCYNVLVSGIMKKASENVSQGFFSLAV